MGRLSERWWRNHHFTRDACGSWTPDDNAGGECLRDDAPQLGSRKLAAKLRKESRAADRAARSKASRRRGRGDTRAELRENTAQAQHAQELRAERLGADAGTRTRKGRVTDERRSFFGQKNGNATATAERRVRVNAADAEVRARRAADRESRAAHVPMSRQERADTLRDLEAAGW